MIRSLLAGGVSLLALDMAGTAAAQDLAAELETLRALVEQQQQLIQQQSVVIASQETRLRALEAQAGRPPGVIRASLSEPPATVSQPTAGAVAQTQQQQTPQPAPSPAGEPPRQADVEIAEGAGLRSVLTPPGRLVVEPSVEFEQTSTNVFFFNGVEVVETILVGDVEITDADRDTITSRVSMRTGLTNRSEIEVSVPFIYRDDRVSSEVITAGGGGATVNDLSAFDIGDVEVTGRYQINDGNDDWPIFIGNLRFKTNTGQGPFDIDRDEDGVETELTTGSGFLALQPSLSFIYPVDPAVFFGSASYTYNISRDVDTRIGGAQIGRVDPGDTVGLSFGVGYALNDRTSISMSYEHNFISGTTTESNGVDVEGQSFDIGSLNLGSSLRLNDRMRLNLGLRAGLTEDAPDVAVTARLPIIFDLF